MPIKGDRLAPVALSVASANSSSSLALTSEAAVTAGELADAQVNLFPNPTSGAVTVSAPAQPGEKIIISVTDGLGRTVHREETVAGGQQINTQLDLGQKGLKAGVYFVRIESGSLNRVLRLVKQ
jgi:hypothetical protein